MKLFSSRTNGMTTFLHRQLGTWMRAKVSSWFEQQCRVSKYTDSARLRQGHRDRNSQLVPEGYDPTLCRTPEESNTCENPKARDFQAYTLGPHHSKVFGTPVEIIISAKY